MIDFPVNEALRAENRDHPRVNLSEVHTGRAFQVLDQLIRRTEAWIGKRDSLRHTPSLDRRLSQRIVEIVLRPFLASCSQRWERGEEPFPAPDEEVICAGLRISGASGRVRIGPMLMCRALMTFAAHWLHVLWVFVLAFVRRAGARGPATLVFGVGVEDLRANGSDARFVEFCRKGPVDPFRAAQRMVVHTAADIRSSHPTSLEYHRFPLHALVAGNRVDAAGMLGFLASHFRALAKYARAVASCPLVSVLGRDFAYQPMVEWLNARGLIDNVIITSTNFAAQPLWMRDFPGRRFKTHMVWYSQNTLPFVYAFDPVAAATPAHRHLTFDETWVWTPGFGDFLRGIGIQAPIRAVGPILFYLPERGDDQGPRGGYRIGVFDVTPAESGIARRLWVRYNYYSAANASKFLQDIVFARNAIDSASGAQSQISIKHKRPHAATHDLEYLRFVDELIRSEPLCGLAPADSNLYSVIGACDLVVVMPWSSPAYVAQQLGVPAIYYDPSGELLPTYERLPGIEFASGRESLCERMRLVLEQKSVRP